MPEFDLDNFKKTWQEQEVQPKYNSSEIEGMLNKKSRNYVKYILWISIAELIVILLMNAYYVFYGDDTTSFMNILEKIGVKKTFEVEKNLSHLYFLLKIFSILMTAGFVYLFFDSYRKINVEENLKKFILQIIKFKKTVNAFIFMNIALLVLFTFVITGFTLYLLSEQHIHMDNSTLAGFITGFVLMVLICVGLIWLYYRIVYGIILSRLGRSLEQLKKIEEND